MKAATMGLVTSLAKPHRANSEVTRIKGHRIPDGITRADGFGLSTPLEIFVFEEFLTGSMFEEGSSAIGKSLSNHINDKNSG